MTKRNKSSRHKNMFTKSINSIVQNVNINKNHILAVVKLNNKIYEIHGDYVGK